MSSIPDCPELALFAMIRYYGSELLLGGGSEVVEINSLTHELLLRMDGHNTVADLLLIAEAFAGANNPDLGEAVLRLIDDLQRVGYLVKS